MADDVAVRFEAVNLVLVKVDIADIILKLVVKNVEFAGVAGGFDLFVFHIFLMKNSRSDASGICSPIRGEIISSRTAVRGVLP